MYKKTLFVVLLCVLVQVGVATKIVLPWNDSLPSGSLSEEYILGEETNRAFADTTPPVLSPFTPAGTTVIPYTALRFAANEALQPSSLICTSSCSCDAPSFTGQTVTVTITYCSAQGPFSATVSVKDVAGNTGSITVNYVYDSVGPTLGAYLPAYTVVKANTALSFYAYIPIQSTGITIAALGCTFTTPTFASQSQITTSVSCSQQGPFSVTVTALDLNGAPGSLVMSYIYDSVAPTVTANTYPGTTVYSYTTTTPLSFTANEPIQPDSIRISASSCTFTPPILTGQTFTTLPTCTAVTTGYSFTITVTVLDTAGNVGSLSVSYLFGGYHYSSTAASTRVKPGTTLTFTPPSTAAYSSPYAVTASSGCTVSSPPTVSGIGGMTLTVTLLNCATQGDFSVIASSNYGSIADTVYFVYDSIPPTFSPSLPPNSKVTANTPLRFTASEALQYTGYSVTVSAGCSCSAPGLQIQTITVSQLISCTTQAPFTVTVTALDTAGNSGTLTVSYVYDSVGPILTPTLAANTRMTSNTLLTFNANEAILSAGITITASGCTLGTPTVTGQTITANLVSCSAQGTFSLTVTAADSLANLGTLTISYVYDSVAPTLAASLTANTKVKPLTLLSFNANEAIQSAGMAYVAAGCTFTSPTVSGLAATMTLVSCAAQGSFSLTANVLDVAGNIGSTTISYIYDSVAPTLTSSLASSAVVTANTPVSFSANENIQTTPITMSASGCSFDTPTLAAQLIATANLVSCTADGPFTMSTTVTDEAGNIGTHLVSYVYDSTPSSTAAFVPSVTANTKVTANTPLSFTSSKALKSTPLSITATGCTFSIPSLSGMIVSANLISCSADGTTTMTITATDTLSNAITYSISYIYDSTGLVFTPSVSANAKVAPNTNMEFTSNKALQAGTISLSAPNCTFTSPPTLAGMLVSSTLTGCTVEGPFTLTISATDSLGNPGTYLLGYVYDSIAPTFTALLAANAPVRFNTSLSFTASEVIQSATITFVATDCFFGTPTLSGLVMTADLVNCSTEGPFSLTVTASDMAGNTGSLLITYVYDTVPPILTPTLIELLRVKPIATLTFTANEVIQPTNMTFVALGCTFDSPTLTGQVVSVILVSCAAQGPFSLNVTILDLAGNAGSLLIKYNYDSVGPIFIPTLVANTKVTANTPLPLTANKMIQATNTTFVAPGCIFDAPTLDEQTVTANLVNCTDGGHFFLEVTVLDTAGNMGSHVISYEYEPIDPRTLPPLLLPNITTSITLLGNYTVGANDTISIAQGSKATVQECLSLDGKLVITGTPGSPGDSNVLFSSQCLQGQFKDVALEEPNSQVCNVQPSYTSFDMSVRYMPCTTLDAGTIAGIVVGCVAFLAVLVTLILLLTPAIRSRIFPNRDVPVM